MILHGDPLNHPVLGAERIRTADRGLGGLYSYTGRGA